MIMTLTQIKVMTSIQSIKNIAEFFLQHFYLTLLWKLYVKKNTCKLLHCVAVVVPESINILGCIMIFLHVMYDYD